MKYNFEKDIEKYKVYLVDNLGMSYEDADLFLSGFEMVNYKKGDVISKEGDKANIVRVLLKGSARGYVISSGNEVVTKFYFENDHIYDYAAYLLKQKSDMYIQALEDLETIEMSIEAAEFLQTEILGYHRMSFHMFKLNYLKVEKERLSFILKTPKERYIDLLQNNKQVILKVPQYQVASYIGISPEHLSRIRKELIS